MDPVLALVPEVLRAAFTGLYIWVAKERCPDRWCSPNLVCSAERIISAGTNKPASLCGWGDSLRYFVAGAATLIVIQIFIYIWWRSIRETPARIAAQIALSRQDGHGFRQSSADRGR